jgi:hypothetical protein
MKTLIIALLALSAPVAAKPTSILPAAYTFEGVARKLENLKLTGCYLDQGDQVMFLKSDGHQYAVNRKSFARIYRDSGRDLRTTLIALDSGQELCKVSR